MRGRDRKKEGEREKPGSISLSMVEPELKLT